MTDIAELRRLETKATPGPWRVVIDDDGNPLSGRPSIAASEELDCGVVHWDGFVQEYWRSARGDKEIHANAALIVAMRNALPELLKALEWQSMESAPKDGTWIEAWRGSAEVGTRSPLVIVRWFDDVWAWPDDTYDPFTAKGRAKASAEIERGNCFETLGFTHWRPLSLPPHGGVDVG